LRTVWRSTQCSILPRPALLHRQDLIELHVQAAPCLDRSVARTAPGGGLPDRRPGEFTARAYLNGKLDLAQAEAVNEIVSSSNALQLEAAERLLAGGSRTRPARFAPRCWTC
jgi:tRNA modification GTPase